VLDTQLVTGVRARGSPEQVERAFRRLLESGVRIRPAGTARRDPRVFLRPEYLPRHRIRLFDATYYLTGLREDPSWEGTLRFFVAYVHPRSDAREVHPRLFGKDFSLVWRSPSHFIRSAREVWMGKGDVRWVEVDGEERLATFEETTNLPFEIQAALDALARKGRPRLDRRAVGLVLRRAPDGRLEPYEDFAAPRRRAHADPRRRIHGGRPVAWFTRRNDPGSLCFAPGFEPDFRRGVVECSRARSRFYGGTVRKFRILSRNRRIQYLFVAAPRHAWIVPPQALSTEITSYGVRSIDVHAAEELCVPGYEYHFVDPATGRLHSQIPEGFAGEPTELDPARVDASAWTEGLPVIRRFRREVLRALRLAALLLALGALPAAAERGADGRFDVRSSPHFLLRQDVDIDRQTGIRGSHRFERDVLAVLEAAYDRLEENLGLRPRRRIEVLVYDPAVFDTTFGGLVGFRAAGFYSGVIRVRGGVTVSAALASTLRHELVHAALDAAAPSLVLPAWLNEGIAEWFEARAAGRRGLGAQEVAVLRAAAAQGLLPSIVHLSAPGFGGLAPDAAGLAYLTSYSLVDHLARRHGEDAVRELVLGLVRSRDLDRSLRRVARLDSFGLEASLHAELGLRVDGGG
jgi:hypothetical protein